MQYICDAGDLTWFRLETTGEAAIESHDMGHAVERYYRDAHQKATLSYAPPKGAPVSEQNIGLKAHIQRAMPLFLTLRDREGKALVTAMLPPAGKDETAFRPIVVGPANADPYPKHGEAIEALGAHYGFELDPARCFPYRRG